MEKLNELYIKAHGKPLLRKKSNLELIIEKVASRRKLRPEVQRALDKDDIKIPKEF